MLEGLLVSKIALIVTLGIAAQWLAWRSKLPAIVLLCVAGFLAGPVFGWLRPSENLGPLVPVIVKVSVAFILFDGGLNLKGFELREAGRGVKRLVFFGLPLAWIFGAAAAYFIAGLSFPVALVLGAILVVTGPTVIIPLIRQHKLPARLSSLLKWEGIVNDPLGALLAVLVFEYFVAFEHQTPGSILIGLGSALVVSFITGWGGAYFMRESFSNGWIPEFLKIPVVLSSILIIYTMANFVQEEAGLLAVTVYGTVLGNAGLKIIDDLRKFKEYIAIFLVSAVFIILTADLEIADLTRLDWRSYAFVGALMFVVRPLGTWLATIGSGMDWRERTFVGWIAPRGVVAASVAGLFAPRLMEVGYSDAAQLVPLVFMVVFSTVIFHGFSVGFVARRLGLASKAQGGLMIVGASPWSVALAEALKDLGVKVILVDNSWYDLREARLAGVQVYYGEVLSENFEQRLDMAEISYLLAATDNDAYNALVCNAFASHLGRDKVLQLALHKSRHEKDEVFSTAKRGRIAMGESDRFEKLLGHLQRGWHFQKTPITEEYGLREMIEGRQDEVKPVVLLRRDKTLGFFSTERSATPGPGDIVVSFRGPTEG